MKSEAFPPAVPSLELHFPCLIISHLLAFHLDYIWHLCLACFFLTCWLYRLVSYKLASFTGTVVDCISFAPDFGLRQTVARVKCVKLRRVDVCGGDPALKLNILSFFV